MPRYRSAVLWDWYAGDVQSGREGNRADTLRWLSLRELGESLACALGCGLVRLGFWVARFDPMIGEWCPVHGPLADVDDEGHCKACGSRCFLAEDTRGWWG